jgi:hypothetical protein
METTACGRQLTFWKIDQQQVTVDFEGGQVVTDAGLLQLRDFERRLGVIKQLAAQFPDPRSPKYLVHTVEAILTQHVYQYLAGYFDANDAQAVRQDPVFLALNEHSPDEELARLASGSTLSRFAYSYTRRQAELPPDEREVLFEQRGSQLERIALVNRYLVDLFVRTRRERPAYVILDLDATDDPTHGQQLLTGFHGYYDQYQYLPLLVFDGVSGFPLAAWLRPGTVHASCGAVQTLQEIVQQLRAVWPDLLILVRGDSGFAIPAMYEFCEREGLLYIFGFGTNAVLKRRTDETLAQVVAEFEQSRTPVQKFLVFEDYQAESWTRARRIVAKVEVNEHGTNRRFVVSNMSGDPQGLYHGFYVQRGKVPEQPIGELKNGLGADRLSSHGFTANSLKFCLHVLAYAIFVLHREATAPIPEVSRASVATVRNTLFKVGAVVKTSVRRIWFHISATWPNRELFLRVQQALDQFLAALTASRTAAVPAPALLLK